MTVSDDASITFTADSTGTTGGGTTGTTGTMGATGTTGTTGTATTATAESGLAHTGANATLPVAIGLLLAGVGASALIVGRRRRQA